MQAKLVNQTGSEIGIISKRIIDSINKQIRSRKVFNRQISSYKVLTWFKNLEKVKYILVKFDISYFYLSISESLLKRALIFGQLYEKIKDHEIKILMNVTKSVLYHQEQVWIKSKNNNNSKLFDATLGGKHGAEVCEIVVL